MITFVVTNMFFNISGTYVKGKPYSSIAKLSSIVTASGSRNLLRSALSLAITQLRPAE